MIARPSSLALAALAAFAVLAAAPTPAAADDREKAAAYFRQGQAYFQRGDFDRALGEYKAAYQLSKEPSLIFNIGLCHDRANRPEEALLAFQRYLELAPNGDVADETREEIARLTPVVEQIRAKRAAEEPLRRERELQEARARRGPPSRVPLYVMGGGAAIGLVGAVFHLLSWRTRGDLEDAPDVDTYFDDRDTFRLQRNLAIAGYAVGAATALTGLILKVTVFRQRDVELAPAVAPGGAGVMLRWSR